jgi:hypothetical protein
MVRLVVASLTVCLLLALRGTPTTYVPVGGRPTAVERETIARSHLIAHGVDLEGYEARQIMIVQQAPTLYLQKILGAVGLADVASKRSLPLFYWQVHLSRPEELRQYWVRVTFDGKVGAFTTRLTETDAGRSLGIAEARRIARRLLDETHGQGARSFREVETSTTVLPRRTDHRLVFSRALDGLGQAEERIAIGIQGGRVGGHRNWIKVPESFDVEQSREETYADALFWTSVATDVLLVIAAVATLLGLLGRRRALGPPARAGLLVFGVLLAAILNYVPVTLASDHSPEKPLVAFLISHVLYLALLAAVPALGTFLMMAAGESLHEEGPDRASSFRLWLAGSWGDPRVRRSMASGLLLALALGGGETLFFAVGQGLGLVVLPVQPTWVNSMGTWFPLLYPLSIGVGAAITEECTFRLFAIGLLTRAGTGRFLALLVPAMAWAFAHSRESVFPVWIRGAELVVGGLLLGWFFLETDLLAVITAHYLYDVVAFGWPLLTSGNPTVTAGAVAVVAVAAVPGVLGLGQLRTGSRTAVLPVPDETSPGSAS